LPAKGSAALERRDVSALSPMPALSDSTRATGGRVRDTLDAQDSVVVVSQHGADN
jgi:hypothetical protein